ncbi:MAG: hypothetical protein R3C19_10640 [Planctomycetaceae bacterium]
MSSLTTQSTPETRDTWTDSSPGDRSWAWTITIVFAVLILIPSMLGFVMKFAELVTLSEGEVDGGFAITPVVNYLLASMGFFCLLLWAAVNGMFKDLESPKHWMLKNEEELDQQETPTNV